MLFKERAIMADHKSIDLSIKNVNKVINMIPGTLVYKGVKKVDLTIEKLEYSSKMYKKETYTKIEESFVLDLALSAEKNVQWINITGINNVNEMSRIGEIFDIDLMLLEQVLDVSKHSSYNISDEYIFNHLQMIYLKDGIISNETISVFLIDNVILTFQERRGDVFDSIRRRLENNEGHIRNENASYTYFCILDAIVDHYINVLEEMKKNIDKMELRLMEDQLLDNKKLHILRKHILIMRLSTVPIGKLVQDILLIDNEPFSEQDSYFESLDQHIKRTLHEISVLKESIDSLYENYMMTNANDMNQIMTILTIFSAIFIPLSFAAGVFGMNFENIPGLNNPLAFLYFIIGCGGTAVTMLSLFKLKKWF